MRTFPRSLPTFLCFMAMASIVFLLTNAKADSNNIPPPHNNEFPTTTLADGRQIPLVGLGCCSGVREAHVLSALETGYRFLDTAQSYAWGYNEDEVGAAVHMVHYEDDVFVQTKIHPEDLGYEATKRAVQVSLKRLDTDHLDSVLIHKPRCWPGACTKEPEGTWQESWKALEELVDEGVIGSIGICDVDDKLLDELLQQRIKPAIIQNWADPYHSSKHIRKRIQAEGILFQGYSSLGSQWIHHRGHVTNPVLNNPQLVAIAAKYNVSVANVIINYFTRHGVSVLPASTKVERQRSNLVDSFTFDLTDEEMRIIDALEGQEPNVPETDPNQVSVTFENQGTESIQSFWVHTDSNDEVHVGTIGAGDSVHFDSFHGHKFVFRKEKNGSMVHQHVVAKEKGQKQTHVVHDSEL